MDNSFVSIGVDDPFVHGKHVWFLPKIKRLSLVTYDISLFIDVFYFFKLLKSISHPEAFEMWNVNN